MQVETLLVLSCHDAAGQDKLFQNLDDLLTHPFLVTSGLPTNPLASLLPHWVPCYSLLLLLSEMASPKIPSDLLTYFPSSLRCHSFNQPRLSILILQLSSTNTFQPPSLIFFSGFQLVNFSLEFFLPWVTHFVLHLSFPSGCNFIE